MCRDSGLFQQVLGDIEGILDEHGTTDRPDGNPSQLLLGNSSGCNIGMLGRGLGTSATGDKELPSMVGHPSCRINAYSPVDSLPNQPSSGVSSMF